MTSRAARASRSKGKIKRIAGKWALAVAAGTALALGGVRAYPNLRASAEREIVRQQKAIEQNIRPRDLHDAQKTFHAWKGLRDMDEIMYRISESFSERRSQRQLERMKFEPRGYAGRSPEEMNDELARLSPEELEKAMENYRTGGFNSRQIQEWKTEIEGLRNEMKTYLRELDARAPERVKKKIRWMYGKLGAGSGLLAAGLYLAIARALRNARLTPAQLENYGRGTQGRPFTEQSSGGARVTLAYADPNGRILVEETHYGLRERDGTRYPMRTYIRTYAKNGKLLSTIESP